jgi:Zn-dependent protease with chaperone function
VKFYEVLNFISRKLQTAFARKMEFRADEYAVIEFDLMGDSISHGLNHFLLKLLKRDNDSNLNPDWLYGACN